MLDNGGVVASSGTVAFVDGKFQTNGAKTSIEVVNLLLGQGNDSLQILGTIDPDIAVKLTGSMIITGRAVGTRGPSDLGGIDLTRATPFDWRSQGYVVGQPIHITGFPSGSWVVSGFSDSDLADTTDNTVMHLTGTILSSAAIAAAPMDLNFSATVAAVTIAGAAGGGTLTRAAGSWITDGFVVGQTLTVNGQTGSWRLQGITNGGTTLVLGNGSALLSAGPASVTVNAVVRTVVADDVPVTSTGTFTTPVATRAAPSRARAVNGCLGFEVVSSSDRWHARLVAGHDSARGRTLASRAARSWPVDLHLEDGVRGGPHGGPPSYTAAGHASRRVRHGPRHRSLT